MRKELLETMARSNAMALQDRWAKKGDEEKKKGVASPPEEEGKERRPAKKKGEDGEHPPAKKARESKAPHSTLGELHAAVAVYRHLTRPKNNWMTYTTAANLY